MNGLGRHPDPQLLHGRRFGYGNVVVDTQGRAIPANLGRAGGALTAAMPRLRENPRRTAALHEVALMGLPV
jgi:hypothetical protein